MNVNKVRTSKIVAIMLLVALLASLITYQHTIAGFQGSQESLPFYLGAPQPYSYIVDTNGTNCFTYNGTTGKLDYSSTSASDNIQYAIDALSSGGKIFVKVGDYDDVHIVWSATSDNVTLEGENGATLIQDNDMLDIIELNGLATDPLENVVVRGFNFQGPNTSGNQCGVWMNNTRNSKIEYNFFNGMASSVDYYPPHCAAILLWFYNYNNTISHNTIYRGMWEGIGCGAGSSFNIISDNIISYTNDNGIDVNGDDGFLTPYNTIKNNIISYGSIDGIQFDSVYKGSIIGNTIIGNDMSGISVAGDVAEPSNFCLIEGNTIYGEGSINAGIMLSWAFNTHVANNYVYDTSDNNIHIEHCFNTSASNNFIYSNAVVNGIAVFQSNHTYLGSNTIIGTDGNGIFLQKSNKTLINGGLIRVTSFGVHLESLNYTSIIGLMIEDAWVAIQEDSENLAGQTFIDGCTMLNCDSQYDFTSAYTEGHNYYIPSAP